MSYRDSDGQGSASAVAWMLRGFGVPVWRDKDDLPPGEIQGRLKEALRGGLSGGVVVATPEIGNSQVIRQTELPALRRLARKPRFALAIASTLRDANGELNHNLPDTLLGLPKGTLAALRQYPADTEEGLAQLARAFALRRVSNMAPSEGQALPLNIQTRRTPMAETARRGLVVRLKPPPEGLRVPTAGSWAPLAGFLDALPDLFHTSACTELRLDGGAHLTAALALGAALPATTYGTIRVRDADGALWGDSQGGVVPPLDVREQDAGQAGMPVGIFVDVVSGEGIEEAFDTFLDETRPLISGAVRLRLASRRVLSAAEGSALARELGDFIRAAAAKRDTTRVHLMLRTPFCLAVLLGQRLNTLEVSLFEWENGLTPPRYVQTLTIASGVGAGPVLRVGPSNDGRST